jgi:hypothetical protein
VSIDSGTLSWVAGGPAIPVEVVQNLQDDDLVVFCGAGVSCPAGLPLFKGLVEAVYQELTETLDDLQQDDFKGGNYDRVLGALEDFRDRARTPRTYTVRQAVRRILSIKDGADRTCYSDLVELCRTKNGAVRLVTTNFDRGFADLGFQPHCAPMLPIPKKETWASVVHLHGLISDSDPNGESLVLTSADFGKAYLTERWASRFITELFRRFSVLFVGYSVSDPVIRYMIDALAADRSIGEGIGEAYALAPIGRSTPEDVERRWRARGIKPILYGTPDGAHSFLYETLRRWAATRRDGLLGRENTLRIYAESEPRAPHDREAVSQVLWAINQDDGHLASYFARLEPAPGLGWLDVFAGVGLVRGPGLAVGDDYEMARASILSNVGLALVEWMCRHLHDPRLLELC